MKIVFQIFFLITLCQPVFGQMKKYNYKSKKEPNSRYIVRDYNFTMEKMNDGSVIVKYYYPENKMITIFYTLKSRKSSIKHGLSYNQTDDGEILTKGSYFNDEKEGSWFEHGAQGEYKKGTKIGKWITRSNEHIIREENYSNGLLDEDYFEYDTKGNVTIHRIYDNGNLINEKVDSTYYIDKIPARFNECNEMDISTEELTKCSTKKMLQFVYSNVKYPKNARKQEIDGMALAVLTIDETGRIAEIKMKRALSIDIKNECERVLSMMPDWLPATENGKAVKSKVEIPIRFELK